jgi:hypothetical protein
MDCAGHGSAASRFRMPSPSEKLFRVASTLPLFRSLAPPKWRTRYYLGA